MVQDDQVPDDAGASPVAVAETSKKDALSLMDRLIEPSDFSHPGVQKLVLDRLDKAEARNTQLELAQPAYYALREELVVAKSKLGQLEASDTLTSTLLGVGCLVLGFVPSLWGHWSHVIIASIAGGAMVLASHFAKRSSRK